MDLAFLMGPKFLPCFLPVVKALSNEGTINPCTRKKQTRSYSFTAVEAKDFLL